jgi:hypothetical protein
MNSEEIRDGSTLFVRELFVHFSLLRRQALRKYVVECPVVINPRVRTHRWLNDFEDEKRLRRVAFGILLYHRKPDLRELIRAGLEWTMET